MNARSMSSGCLLAAALLAGCSTVSREQNVQAVRVLVSQRSDVAPAPARDPLPGPEEHAARVAGLLAEPLTLQRAMDVAFLSNARIREEYARLGIAEADVYEASRIANPSLGYTRLRSSEAGEGAQVTRAVAVSFADLLLLPASRRFALGDLERVRASVAAELLELASEVERSWFEHVSALQVAAMRAAARSAAESSAEFARRAFAAGNLTPRDLALHAAAASEARIEATRAAAEVARTRVELARAMGVAARESWQVPDRLPAPHETEPAHEALLAQALETRLDLAAARREATLMGDALGVARRWRWLGEFRIGYEREEETDGAELKGPSFEFQLPIFNSGRSSVLRARSELEEASARLSSLELAVRNEVSLGLDRVQAARQIAEGYRSALVPQREEIVRRELERYNYMLVGVFELLQAKREELDAYQEYLEAVRDYWLARSELRLAAGGRLPGDEQQPDPTIGADAILNPRSDPAAPDHSPHDHSRMDHSKHDAPPDRDRDAEGERR